MTKDQQLIEEERHKLAQTELEDFINKMTTIGFSKDRLTTILDHLSVYKRERVKKERRILTVFGILNVK